MIVLMYSFFEKHNFIIIIIILMNASQKKFNQQIHVWAYETALTLLVDFRDLQKTKLTTVHKIIFPGSPSNYTPRSYFNCR